MLKKKNAIKGSKPLKCDSKLLTMQEAMQYLDLQGIPCKNRSTFYRILDDFQVEFIITNPNGKHAIRRFKKEALNKVLEANGLN